MNTAQEKKFAACYEKLKDVMQIDYPVALNVFRCFEDFVAEHLNSEFEIVWRKRKN